MEVAVSYGVELTGLAVHVEFHDVVVLGGQLDGFGLLTIEVQMDAIDPVILLLGMGHSLTYFDGRLAALYGEGGEVLELELARIVQVLYYIQIDVSHGASFFAGFSDESCLGMFIPARLWSIPPIHLECASASGFVDSGGL